MDSEISTKIRVGGSLSVSTAVRQRLQKVFEHGQRCAEKQDYDYAHKLFTQCLTEDPCNLVYVQHFLSNLQKKYANNRKGSRLASLKIKGHRSTLDKACSKGDWEAAFVAGCAALALNPWDIPTLRALASAYAALQSDECELFCLRSALGVDANHVEVNRQAGVALQRMGLFDQAIACWQRVQAALPEDDEARQSVARLSVEKTIDQGGYDPALLDSQAGLPLPSASVAKLAKNSVASDDRTPAQRLQEAIAAEPTVAENYVQLADIYLHEKRFDEAEELLEQGLSACGRGDLQIRTRMEDTQLRRVGHYLAIAEKQLEENPSPEAEQLAHRFRVQANQVELETYAARADRDPKDLRVKFELGMRLKRAGKVKEAISALQAARADTRRGSTILVELGECFQHLQQYKLAITHYEQAIEASEGSDAEIHRKALYRAAVLATGMQEIDRAERHLTALAALDFSYRDVAERLDKIAKLRNSN